MQSKGKPRRRILINGRMLDTTTAPADDGLNIYRRSRPQAWPQVLDVNQLLYSVLQQYFEQVSRGSYGMRRGITMPASDCRGFDIQKRRGEADDSPHLVSRQPAEGNDVAKMSGVHDILLAVQLPEGDVEPSSTGLVKRTQADPSAHILELDGS